MPQTGERQALLFLYTANSAADSDVVAWSHYDGAAPDAATLADALPTIPPQPPYASPLEAMRAGWRVIGVQHVPRDAADPHQTSVLRHCYILERMSHADG